MGSRSGHRWGFGTARVPVVGRKGHAQEGWARCRKLQTDLRLAATHRTEECHMALLFLFRFVVLHVNHGAAGEASREQDQGPVGIYGQSFREFLEIDTLSALPAYADGHLHQHALTAAPSSRTRGCIRDLSHATSLQIQKSTIPCGTELSSVSSEAVFKVDTVLPNCAARSERSGAYRIRGRSGEAAQFFARGRGASLPTARSTPKCAESRTGLGTWSSESPSIDK